MAYLVTVLFSMCMFFPSVSGQVSTCDQYTNPCINGVCEIQANQQLGCTCAPGFILDPIDHLQCHRIPACNFLQGAPEQQCLNGVCRQLTSGAFGCICYPGYQLSSSNPNICENVDECQSPYNGCAPNSCTDVVGDYSCVACIQGYTLDQRGKCQRFLVTQPYQVYQAAQTQQAHNEAQPWMLMPWVMDGMFF